MYVQGIHKTSQSSGCTQVVPVFRVYLTCISVQGIPQISQCSECTQDNSVFRVYSRSLSVQGILKTSHGILATDMLTDMLVVKVWDATLKFTTTRKMKRNKERCKDNWEWEGNRTMWKHEIRLFCISVESRDMWHKEDSWHSDQ